MIKIRDLSAGYGDRTVLKQVNMTFQPGKVTVLIGPNGSGKSTLLKTIVGLIEKTGGTVFINKRPAEYLSSAELARNVAYLPQNRRAPDISVLKMVLHGRFAYLSYPRRYRPKDVEIARKALCWAGLLEKEEEMVSKLSGGMQQKVYIAMALAQDADTILMDEPTAYLDVAHQIRLMEMAEKLASEGKAVVMVLHDLSKALRTADEVIVLYEGEVVQTGSPEEVYESGILEKVFDVEIERIQTKSGWHYVCV